MSSLSLANVRATRDEHALLALFENERGRYASLETRLQFIDICTRDGVSDKVISHFLSNADSSMYSELLSAYKLHAKYPIHFFRFFTVNFDTLPETPTDLSRTLASGMKCIFVDRNSDLAKIEAYTDSLTNLQLVVFTQMSKHVARLPSKPSVKRIAGYCPLSDFIDEAIDEIDLRELQFDDGVINASQMVQLTKNSPKLVMKCL